MHLWCLTVVQIMVAVLLLVLLLMLLLVRLLVLLLIVLGFMICEVDPSCGRRRCLLKDPTKTSR